MTDLELRPRFKKRIRLKPPEIIKRIKSALDKKSLQIEASIVTNHVYFRIPQDQQHYWSPQLSLELQEDSAGTMLRGLYGPSPKVWTMFMFIYMGIGFFGLIGLFYGLSQWSLNITPNGLWIVPAAIVLEIIFYFIARTGKKLAADQMKQLQEALNNILNLEGS